MTTVYFVRHCQSDHSVHVRQNQAPDPQGLWRTAGASRNFLRDKPIEAVLSSPYRRAMDTVRDFADTRGFSIEAVEDFRERAVGDRWVEDFMAFVKRHWEIETTGSPAEKACGRCRPGTLRRWERC